MKVHRFIGGFDLGDKNIVVQDTELVHQIVKVLKLQKGEAVILSDGQGIERLGEIKNIGRNQVMIEFKEKMRKNRMEGPEVVLYLAILKKENFELVAQKATEVGVSTIVPIITERTVKLNLQSERIKKIIKEASEQSGRSSVPQLLPTISFLESLGQIPKNEERWFFDIEGESLQSVSRTKEMKGRIHIFIGPEGGWSEEEKLQAKKKGCKMISMGSLTLRGETAAIIGSYLAVNQ